MADVRSLLRSELASRRGSPQTGTSATNRVTKKRKVDPTETLTRKKVRHTNPEQLLASAQIRPPAAQIIAEEEENDDVETAVMRTEIDTPAQIEIAEETVETTTQSFETPSILPSEPITEPQAENVDEDEWAAFEREVAAPTRVSHRPAAIAAAATISAAPVTAEELAALQEKEKEDMRRNREAEVEGEREDAARFLEEEFDEMEQLEERLRRLKNMREQLRVKRKESAEMDEDVASGVVASEPGPNTEGAIAVDGKDEDGGEEEEDDDDDDDDDWDNWRF
ncbi:hypothetical protein BDV12DRAFT_174414, partial [Aspergillus spectabilis]